MKLYKYFLNSLNIIYQIMSKKVFILVICLTAFGCTDFDKKTNYYEMYGDASIDNKLYDDVKSQLENDFGKPFEVESSKLPFFDPFLFNGPKFSKEEGKKLEDNYYKEQKKVRQKYEKTVKGKRNVNIESWEYQAYESNRNDTYNDFYQLYLEKNGKTVYTVQQFLNDYILKYPELSLDEAVNLLSDKIRNIETFITYKYKVHDAIYGFEMGYDSFKYMFTYLDVNVNFLTSKVDSVNAMVRDADKNDKKMEAAVSWSYILIFSFLLYILGYFYSKKSTLVVYTGWKSIFFSLLTSIPLYIILIEYSDPTLKLVYNNVYFYIFLFLIMWTMFISYKNNTSIKNTFLSMLFRFGLLILLPIFFIGFLISFGYGKQDLRHKDGTKGNERTQAIGTMGAILVLLIGPFMKK